MNTILEEYIELCKDMKESDSNCIPLCAAQTHISSFCKKPLLSDFEGKYSFKEADGTNSFIGGEYVERLNSLLSQQCKLVFGAEYVNADTLTGINCFSVCAMCLLKRGDHVLVTTPEQGGHSSIPIILDSLGVHYDTLPFDFSHYQIDYEKTNQLLSTEKYKFIIFCQSDIINPPNLGKLLVPEETGILYDGTQLLGLIAGKATTNPLTFDNVVLIGGSHKTLPAPACGLIMTNNEQYKNKLHGRITPKYLRNTQPNHVASLLLSLIEQEKYGEEYQRKVVHTANLLGQELEKVGFKLAKVNDSIYTHTHQLFLLTSPEEAKRFYYNAQMYNITLNKKNKKLFHNDGIRLGTQQIARYDWDKEEMAALSQLLRYVFCGKTHESEILAIRKELIAKKIPKFEYEEIVIE